MKSLNPMRFNLFIGFLAVIILCSVPFLHAQERQKIPSEFYTGKPELFKDLLEITEEHLLSEFTFENTLKYKSKLQQLLAEILKKYPEYKKDAEFGKILEITDEYLQKELSHKTTLEYCRQLSKILIDFLEKQKIPVEFFGRKWVGVLTGNLWEHQSKNEPPINIDFSIEINGSDAILYPFEAKGGVTIIPMGSKGPFIPVIENNKQFYENVILTAMFDVGENPSPVFLGFVSMFIVEPLDNQVDLKNDRIQVKHIREEYSSGRLYSRFTVEGTINAREQQKKIFPKDIKPNEPIKTDKKTQLEIIMPSKDVIKIAPNTEAVFKSDSLLEIVKGRLHGFIKKLEPKTKFEIHTPNAILRFRWAEFTVEVEDDGTTTVRVFDGEVELSDKENKKTVTVKKNQQSTIKPCGLPSDPIQLNTDQFLIWWE